jgi:hypothetical protein
MIVSDGYIRDAEVYVDVNGDGIADADELRAEVTSDSFGQIILTDEFLSAPENTDEDGNPYQVIIKGGVNVDSGAPNEIELTAPAGYSVINPLSTLVQEIASSLEVEGASQAEKDAAKVEAEASLADSLGISLDDGSSLGSYDPQSDDNVANRVVATQIATVLAVASSTESAGAETAALASLADTITEAEGSVTLDSETLGDALEGLIDADSLETIGTAVNTMEAVKNSQDDADFDLDAAFEEIVLAQAKAIDNVAPKAPVPALATESNSGVSDSDNLTNDTSPEITINLDTTATDGTAVVAGDTVVITSNDKSETYVLSEEDIENGSFSYYWQGVLTDGVNVVSAIAIDRAGNESEYVSNFAFEVDTTELVISSGDTAESIDENSGDNQVIYTATVDGDDLWKFELTEDSDSALTIDSVTGEVTLNTNPNYEIQSQYSFAVTATDNAGNESAVHSVTLNINNLDEIAPTITSATIADTIDENSGAGQVIYTATADDSSDISAGVTFSLAGIDAAAFAINEDSGEVTLLADPDHETQSEYSFTVIASDGVNDAVEQSVTLDINNLDEIAPSITSGDTATAVNENSGEGQVVYTATATDDADTSDGFSFSLADDSLGFSIGADTGVVTTNADFAADYENAQSQSFTVVATDVAGNASEQVVSVAINNLDEVAPSITSGDTATAIDENSGAGQVVYTATASDTDFNGLEDITFSLADESLGFSIDADGVVTTNASFEANYEDAQSQSFTVVATDAAGNTSEQVVSVAINNLDEVAPSITSGDTATAVNENSGEGQVVYTATATDDADTSDGFSFSLADDSLGFSIDADTGVVTTNADFAADYEDAQSQSFTVVATDVAGNASEQVVSVAINNLDEVAPSITSVDTGTAVMKTQALIRLFTQPQRQMMQIPVMVSRSALLMKASALALMRIRVLSPLMLTLLLTMRIPSHRALPLLPRMWQVMHLKQVVSVAINNLDEVAPVINSGDTATAINENSGEGQVVYTATASDTDFNGAEDITFSLADDSLGFSIDAATGVVTTNTDFESNYEDDQSQSFTVVTTDGAGNASEQVVSVAINNLDEVAPSITSGDTGTAVNENSGADQVVYTATASDTDFNGAEDITFSLADDSLGFSIDADTGVVTTNDDFAADYENTQSQSFTVVATDAAGNASEQVVSVAINNLDEVAPSITSGDTGTAVDENSGADQVVYTATASDTDFNGLEDITFSLADESLGFSIDASTGVVTTNTDFESNFEDAQSQSFTVVATDAAGKASEQVVNVAINNLDEVAPSITSGDTGTAVNENSGADQVVYTATASDTDFNGLEDITFSLADESLGFSIDASTGVVTTNTDFESNYEDDQSQSFTVVATDGAGNASEQVVSVAINNLDEVAPSIDSGDTATAVDENSGEGQVVYTATASDTDFNGAEDITFSLADDSLGFSIDADTGVVTTNADFAADYENTQSQSFTVVATDAAGNASEQVVNVAINNLDEVAPVINSGDTATAIDENSGEGQVVYTATASDTDFNGLEDITFSLADESLGFSIDASTGVVTTNTDFAADYEDAQSQSFTVVATDAAGNATEQEVSLEINNLDEVAPSITSGDTATAIDENSGEGQVVYTATASDTDFNGAEDITFSLADDSLGFSIDASTGVVTTNADFESNFEDAQSQSFTVVAADAAGNASEQVVSVAINNLDEVAPSITSGDTGTAVNENSGADQVVYTATASDTDFNGLEDITFSLADESLGFSIDASTGVVTTNADFAADYEDAQSQSFTVVATDAAGNASEQVVSVAINNLDEVAPSITSGDTGTAVNENSGADQVVYTATASDTDFNGLEDITFSLADESLGFSIDADTGVVTTNADFAANYEDAQSQSFTVVATDVAGNASDQVVSVAINNLDEVAPSITSGDTATAVDENSGSGQVVYTATADDSLDTSDGVTFSLADEALGFSIDADGVVTTNDDFAADYENAQSQSFTVVVTDAADNAADQVVSVAINNLDEVAPSITSGDTATAIDENSGSGQVVYTATADDSLDTSDGVTFSLADEALGFSIDADGVVTTNDDFAADYENAQSQSFTVVATDGAGNASEQVVSVAINNLDEVAPSITSRYYCRCD